MTTDLDTLGRNDELLIAEDLMEMKRIRHLPVLEEGRLIGIVSQRDLFHAALSSTMGYGKKAQDAYLKSIYVKEVMTEDVVTIGPLTDLMEAARIMVEKKIGCLPVVEDQRLLGLISETDLVRLVAEGKSSV